MSATASRSASHGNFGRGVVLSGIGSVATLAFLLLETVVVARLLPADTYGSYVLLLATVNFLVMAIDFGCKVAITQLIAGGDRARQKAVIGSALVFRVVVVACVSALLWVFHGVLAVVDPSPTLVEYVGYLPLMIATASFDELLSAVLQGFQAYGPLTAAQVARGVLRIALTAVLLVQFHAGIAALVYSWSVSYALTVAYQYWAMPVRQVWRWRWSVLLELLRFGFPMQMTRFLGFVSARVHLALLATLAGPAGVAYFAVAARIPDALQTLAGSFFRVYFPTMATLLAAGQRQAAGRVFDRSLRLVSFAGALAAVTATVFRQELVILLFSPKYAGSAPVFALLMLALHMTLVVNVMGYTLTAAGRPGRSLAVDVVQTVVSAGGDLLLIRPLGALGSAVAAMAATYVSNPAAAWLVRRSEIPFALAPYAKQTLIVLLCAALSWWAQPAGIVYKAAILALFVGLSLLASTISPDDVRLLTGSRFRRSDTVPQPLAAPIPVAAGNER